MGKFTQTLLGEHVIMIPHQPSSDGWQPLGRATDVGINEHFVYDTENGPIIIVNLKGEFYALDDICTHDGGILSDGWIDNDDLVCPRHGAHFCIKTGEAISPPAYEPISSYPVKITDGKIWVKLP